MRDLEHRSNCAMPSSRTIVRRTFCLCRSPSGTLYNPVFPVSPNGTHCSPHGSLKLKEQRDILRTVRKNTRIQGPFFENIVGTTLLRREQNISLLFYFLPLSWRANILFNTPLKSIDAPDSDASRAPVGDLQYLQVIDIG